MKNKKIIGLIPARMNSSRFPGKPLALILNKPMIYWVYKQASKVNGLDELYIATEDFEIYHKCIELEIPVKYISEYFKCNCAADKLSYLAKRMDGDIYLNIQGDEPLINPKAIEQIIDFMVKNDQYYYVGLKSKISTEKEFKDPSVVKVIVDKNDNALTFSRSPIPYNFDPNNAFRVMGIYGYSSEFLKIFADYDQSNLEFLENGVEMLRMIENGYTIHLLDTTYSSIGVDLPEHIKLVEQELLKNNTL